MYEQPAEQREQHCQQASRVEPHKLVQGCCLSLFFKKFYNPRALLSEQLLKHNQCSRTAAGRHSDREFCAHPPFTQATAISLAKLYEWSSLVRWIGNLPTGREEEVSSVHTDHRSVLLFIERRHLDLQKQTLNGELIKKKESSESCRAQGEPRGEETTCRAWTNSSFVSCYSLPVRRSEEHRDVAGNRVGGDRKAHSPMHHRPMQLVSFLSSFRKWHFYLICFDFLSLLYF